MVLGSLKISSWYFDQITSLLLEIGVVPKVLLNKHIHILTFSRTFLPILLLPYIKPIIHWVMIHSSQSDYYNRIIRYPNKQQKLQECYTLDIIGEVDLLLIHV